MSGSVGGLALGLSLGSALGVGLCLVLGGAPPLRRPRLHDRLAPYLRDAPRASRLLTAPAGASAPRGAPLLLAPFLPLLEDVARHGGRALAAVSGSSAALRARLDQAGSTLSVEAFRVQQVLAGLGGLGAGCVIALALALRTPRPLGPGLAAVALATVVGVLARDQALTRAVRARSARIAAELPTITELLALSVAAGEGAVGALERVARSSGGELAGELRRTLADARSGATLVAALEAMAARTNLPSLARFVDGVVVAVERGTPLADVLRAQAQDVREQGRRELLEAGGRKEIAMMVPVVFLVLPVTVVFAVFPGLHLLQLSPS